MGVVYKAQDSRLDRTVALKFLGSQLLGDDEAKARFLREAKAAASLDHPNVCTVYEVGEADGTTFLAMALIEGESLEARIARSPLPLAEALEIGRQIAEGLQAAHEKGVIHRDIKPANIMVDPKGLATIMDFGLARLAEASRLTKPESTLGTVAYMSPEQLQGAEVDQGTDILALGVVLYEMVAGLPPFKGEYEQALGYEIVNESPAPLTGIRAGVPMELEFTIAKCLEKKISDRYGSTSEVAVDLRRIARELESDSRSRVRPAVVATSVDEPGGRRPKLGAKLLATMALLAIVLLAAAFIAGSRMATLDPPTYTRLTFRRGNITGARFAPNGDEIIYSAAWDGGPAELYSTRPGSTSSRNFGIESVDILAISRSGEMALRERTLGQTGRHGTLYTAPLAGGVPRAVLDDVIFAGWNRGGELGVVRLGGGKNRLEVPIGTSIHEFGALPLALSFAPDGRIALAERGHGFGRSWNLLTFDGGTKPTRSEIPGFGTSVGLAWDPDGDGIWYESGELGGDKIFMLTPGGDREVVLGIPGQMRLLDASGDGRVLLSRSEARAGIRCLAPGESSEQELPGLDFSDVNDMTSDGHKILLSEFGEAGGLDSWSVYLQDTDGTPAVMLAAGQGLALSPDGARALTFDLSDPPQIVIRPTGAGEPLRLVNPGFTGFSGGDWHPDGDRVLFAANAGGVSRIYIQDLDGGAPQAVTPEGINVGFGERILSPNGKWILGETVAREVVVYPFDGGEPRLIAVPDGTEGTAGWSADSSSIYVFGFAWGKPNHVYEIRLSDGETSLWKELNHPDPAGIVSYWGLQVSDDELSYCYSYMRNLSSLYLVEGLR